MAKKTGLGRGLGALINPDLTEESQAELPPDDGRSVGTYCMVSIYRIVPNPYQPRRKFDPEKLAELTRSIKEKGVIQAINVRRKGDKFELISGERRVRASKEAGLTELPAYIMDVDSDREMLELALVENVQREDLNPIEVAIGYQQLIKECDLTQEKVAERVGKDRSTVTNLLRLLRLPDEVQESLRHGEISMGHARTLLTLQKDDQQIQAWRKVVDQGLSVRRAESLVKHMSRESKSRPGAGTKAVSKAGTNGAMDAGPYREVADRLREALQTQVKVRGNAEGQGTISFDFYSAEELERLVEILEEVSRNL
jgi:ParB family chromosome partitioning protein